MKHEKLLAFCPVVVAETLLVFPTAVEQQLVVASPASPEQGKQSTVGGSSRLVGFVVHRRRKLDAGIRVGVHDLCLVELGVHLAQGDVLPKLDQSLTGLLDLLCGLTF